MPQAPAYAAAKAGLINFARSMTPRLAKRGIRVCAVCPQPVSTPMASLCTFPVVPPPVIKPRLNEVQC
jgi:NAD(P)-dependent dehydrogenase (short-subunit alcohol dehydrogenase family)